MIHILDVGVTDVHTTMYQSWAFPRDLKKQPQPVLKNWHPEDLAAFCGGQYTTK